MRRSRIRILMVLGLLGGAAACDSGADPGDEASENTSGDTSGDGDATIDEDAIASAAVDYASYTAISAAPFVSAHAAAASVQIWVPSEWADLYRAVDPDDPEATASFPAGALIIKEHLDADGEASGLTVMAKGPAGYDPDAGDWWWGAIGLDGTINAGGAVSICIDCHSPRADADWVFGVAPADQS